MENGQGQEKKHTACEQESMVPEYQGESTTSAAEDLQHTAKDGTEQGPVQSDVGQRAADGGPPSQQPNTEPGFCYEPLQYEPNTWGTPLGQIPPYAAPPNQAYRGYPQGRNSYQHAPARSVPYTQPGPGLYQPPVRRSNGAVIVACVAMICVTVLLVTSFLFLQHTIDRVSGYTPANAGEQASGKPPEATENPEKPWDGGAVHQEGTHNQIDVLVRDLRAIDSEEANGVEGEEEYLVVSLHILNLGKETAEWDMGQIVMRDQDGIVYKQTYPALGFLFGTMPETVTLDPRTTIRGTVIFPYNAQMQKTFLDIYEKDGCLKYTISLFGSDGEDLQKEE